MINPKREGQFLLNEAPEVALVGGSRTGDFFLKAFPALAHRNYQLYFSGQGVSLIGTWLQIVAQGWLVLELTHSAFWVGTVASLNTLPILLFGLLGGVIVDRTDKKRLLLVTQAVSMILAFVLGALTISGTITVFQICVLALILGVVTAIDMPARQSFQVEIVGKEDLPSAIAINAGIFNAGRVIGPALAGILIGAVGLGGTFIINGFTFFAVIIALYFIKVKKHLSKTHPHPLIAVKQGVAYVMAHKLIKILLVFAAVTAIFGWSSQSIMPVVVREIYGGTAADLGYFYAAIGAGSLVAMILVSAFSKRIQAVSLILAGALLFALSMIAFSFTHTKPLAYLFLFLAGLGLITQYAMMNTTIQRFVKDSFRGRVLSIYVLMFIGMVPVGSFEMGYVAELLGSAFAVRLGAFVVLAFSIYLLLIRKKLHEFYRQYESSAAPQ